MVGGDKDGELLYMAPWSPLCCIETKTKTQHLLTWTRFIVLTSNQKPLTKISPFIIEKTIKGCAGEVKNVTKLRSGSLMIECFRKQQSLNLLALKHVNDINISASPHRTLNSSRGIIRYRDDDLSELTDAEICKELEPQGIINVKRFISRKTGQEVKLNTFLITFNTPNIPTSIRIGLYNVKVNPYIPNPACTLLQMSEIWTWTRSMQRENHLFQVFRGGP